MVMTASDPWHSYQFTVGMPHMAPGKLSEVEFLKLLGGFQWETISGLFGIRSNEIVSELNERLYASFINVELNFGNTHGLDHFGESTRIQLKNRISIFGKSFIDGLFVFDFNDIPDGILRSTQTVLDLRKLDLPWVYMTNAFIAPLSGNSKLKVFEPKGADFSRIQKLERLPPGISEQEQVQMTGRIEGFGDPVLKKVVPARPGPICYKIVQESDLNGAGLLYFARYVAMMNYGERMFLTGSLQPALSSHLVNFLSTDRRRTFYFSNADPFDSVDIHISAEILQPDAVSSPPPGNYATLFKILFRIDLYRHSDNVLMASSLVKKSLNIPRYIKSLIMEAERFLNRVKES